MASSSSSSSPLKLVIISIILLSFTLSLLLFPPKLLSHTPSKSRLLLESSSPPPDAPCSGVRRLPADRRCDAALTRCRGDSHGLLNYAAIHFCLLAGDLRLSLPALTLLLLFQFYFLVSAARDHFSPVVTRLAAHLRLSPSMAAVTLLALGNGSPDVFASVAAVRGGHARTGLGAILSAGAFVSAFVVGAVAVLAGPFPLNPGPFVRDVFFYLIAASALFYVYLSAEIFLWQAVGFILFYLFFVGFVFWMDLVVEGRRVKEGEVEMGLVVEEEEAAPNKPSKQLNWESRDVMGDLEDAKARSARSLYGMLGKISQVWEAPVATLLKLTIPSTSPSEWNRNGGRLDASNQKMRVHAGRFFVGCTEGQKGVATGNLVSKRGQRITSSCTMLPSSRELAVEWFNQQ